MSDAHEHGFACAAPALQEALLFAPCPQRDELAAVYAARQLVVRKRVWVPQLITRTAELFIERAAPPHAVRRRVWSPHAVHRQGTRAARRG
ncbi:hypothetical protein FOMPIDRAFT_1025077 [Fomitopsis schrenkii]|uniref:Uncharacterized protein n=1 Tax=Fomitopsis schrenkii TaxID=2126942 RepID=S8DVU4_FOMSC|nr:hypothetical protein FOMPIDRAFT_1025077 [Fomitopsis schrenkii]